MLRSVVKVLCVSDCPDYEQPWQTQGPTSSFGSGAIIETSRGLRVLTNAHCVEYHVFVEVRRYGKAQKFEAVVEAIGHECDLALLEVSEESFFEGITPIPLGGLPTLGDGVSVCGFPIGGDRLSITQGIVSRIELVDYVQSQRHLLSVQIDAAINAGNSGGPVMKDDRMIGVAFQALDEADQIGYIIATPVVEHFLKAVEMGKYKGFPGLGTVTQKLDSKAHRRNLRIPSERNGGVLITGVNYGGSAWKTLKKGDVLLGIDGIHVDSDATVPLRRGQLIHFEYLVSSKHVGDMIPVEIWREGERKVFDVKLRAPQFLVAEGIHDLRPSYYIVGGLVFAPLTRSYLETWGEFWTESAPRDLMALLEHGIRTPDRQEPVVLQKVLADRVNQGYHDITSAIIHLVQGQKIKSIKHLVNIVRSSKEEFLVFQTADGVRIVIEREIAQKRHDIILKRFGVPQARSADLA